MNIVVINAAGEITHKRAFDTFMRSNRIESFRKQVPRGSIVAVAVRDEGTRKLNKKMKWWFKQLLGSKEIFKLGYR